MPKLPPKKPRSWEVQRPPQAGRNFVNPWYHTSAWRNLRKAILRDSPYCVECKKADIVTIANIVDHIKPVSTGKTANDREDLMWRESNLQPLCKPCHESKSGKERHLK
jgi:5-methylcytosine-specific restriction enzyme A